MPKPEKTNGTLRITKAKWSMGDEKAIPGKHHHVLVYIERVDFKGPVKVTIKNLPPGEYIIEAWHEKLGTQSMKVTVGDKETKEISFSFKAS